MHIFNPPLSANFTTIPNALLRDATLSAESRGVLVYLLSHSSQFKMTNAEIQKHFKLGRDKVERIKKELQQHGYVRITPIRDGRGVYIGWDWNVYSEPLKEEAVQSTEKPCTGSATTLKTHSLAELLTGKPSIVLEETEEVKETLKKEETVVAVATTTSGKPSVTGKKEKTLVAKKPKADQFATDTLKYQICRFLLSFCRFVKTTEQRQRISKGFAISVKNEANELIDMNVTVEDLQKFAAWYSTTYSGRQRKAGDVYNWSIVRNNWDAFQGALITKPDGTTTLPAKDGDIRYTVKYAPDGQTVELWNKATNRLFRVFTVAEYQKAFPAQG
jgi:hypothetical protein